MNKKVILIVLGIIAAVVAFLMFTQPSEEVVGVPSEHKVGAGTSGVVLVEYGDFQCPGCAAYYPALQQVKEYYGDEITFQFRHFPLESIHKNARAAAMAAEAAGKQGKFWEMHNKLFETQKLWETTANPVSTFEGFATEVGVADIEKFKTDYRSSEVKGVINADLKAGRALGASSTPTLILDGQILEPLPGASFEAIKQLIDAKIKEKTGKDPVNGAAEESPAPEESQTTETVPAQ